MAIRIRFRFAKGARMFELHGLIFFRIVAAVLAVAALMVSPVAEAAQCGDEMSSAIYANQTIDAVTSDGSERDSPQPQVCAHGHCHHLFAALVPNSHSQTFGETVIVTTSFPDVKITGEAHGLPQRPPRS
ncbi:MAG TPA: hypothetical protein DCL34_03690 [Erythrobacter sp.]|nr:hypothetical protein [Erythrobacter sp.]